MEMPMAFQKWIFLQWIFDNNKSQSALNQAHRANRVHLSLLECRQRDWQTQSEHKRLLKSQYTFETEPNQTKANN